MSRSARMLSLLAGFALSTSSASAQPTQPTSPAPAATAPPPQTAPQTPAPSPQANPTAAILFNADAGLVFNPIRADRTADFEFVIGKLREALRTSSDPIRQAQGRHWQVFKAEEAGPGGTVIYVFKFDQTVKGADYTLSRIIAEAFPGEVDTLWAKIRDAYAGGMYRLVLHNVPEAPTPSSQTPASPTPSTPLVR